MGLQLSRGLGARVVRGRWELRARLVADALGHRRPGKTNQQVTRDSTRSDYESVTSVRRCAAVRGHSRSPIIFVKDYEEARMTAAEQDANEPSLPTPTQEPKAEEWLTDVIDQWS